jgi:hypothetical protein
MRLMVFPLSVAFTCAAGVACAQVVDMVKPDYLEHARIKTFHPTPHDLANGRAHARHGIFSIDSIPNFNGQYFVNGYDPAGNPNRRWFTNTVGNPPQMGKTTTIGAPIQPVNIELDDANGNLRHFNGKPLISPVSQFVEPVLASPVFSTFQYSSGPAPTQFSDAVHRAEYFNHIKPDWHTLLAPKVLPPVTMHIRQPANCPTGPNFAGCNYAFAPNADGTCCAFILVNDAAPDFVFETGLAGIVVNNILGGQITTKDISSYLFPNVFLFDGDTTQCCVLGFHTYFLETGLSVEPRWVIDYASWISPGLFGPNFVDITGLSHEISEIYDDPFVGSDGVHNITPWWLAPNGNCDDVREAGDPTEGLPNSTYPITLNGFTYHPGNMALLQWFEQKSPSDALGGAYSYPNTDVLQSPPSSLLLPGCP